jgi:hypothetical protein
LQRFSAHHSLETGVWTLQIKYTQLRDEGEYQCQVNTEPKISFSVFLIVLGKYRNIFEEEGQFELKLIFKKECPTEKYFRGKQAVFKIYFAFLLPTKGMFKMAFLCISS